MESILGAVVVMTLGLLALFLVRYNDSKKALQARQELLASFPTHQQTALAHWATPILQLLKDGQISFQEGEAIREHRLFAGMSPLAIQLSWGNNYQERIEESAQGRKVTWEWFVLIQGQKHIQRAVVFGSNGKAESWETRQ